MANGPREEALWDKGGRLGAQVGGSSGAQGPPCGRPTRGGGQTLAPSHLPPPPTSCGRHPLHPSPLRPCLLLPLAPPPAGCRPISSRCGARPPRCRVTRRTGKAIAGCSSRRRGITIIIFVETCSTSSCTSSRVTTDFFVV